MVGSRTVGLLAAEWALRLAAVAAAVAALWMVLGSNGLGLVSAYGKPGATDDASVVMSERTALSGGPGLASVRAANDRLGPLEERSDRAASGTGRPGHPELAEVSGPAEVSVAFWNPSRSQRWAWLLVRAVPAAAVAVGLWLLALITRTARRGDPFTQANVRRLAGITAAVAVTGVVGSWGAALVRRWLLDASELRDQVPLDFSLSFGFVGVVLVLGVLTEVWRRGVAMRQDLEGLV
jgi:hypothetical protein